jgi:hypothetical protein
LPDGKRIVVQGREPGHDWRYYIQSVEGGAPRPFTPEGTSSGALYAIILSPDGKLAVALDSEQNAFIYPVEGSDSPRTILGLEPEDTIIRWGADGRSLLVARTEELPIKVHRLDPATGRKELLKEITPADPAGIFWPNEIRMTPDGKSYVYKLQRFLSDLFVVEGLK